FVRLAQAGEVGVLLAHPRGPIDPTASIKRGVFAPADTWVSTEYLFRKDDDGDFWLVDNRGSVIRTARGPVFAAAVNDAAGRVGAVDLSVTYRVEVDGLTLAVTALALAPGGSVPTADLNEALAGLAVGVPPDIIHVVPEMKLSASYRPLLGPLEAVGIPKPSRNAWYLDDETGVYRRLTTAVRAEMMGDGSTD
ncbi:MAG: putative long chain acyl-CoA synthase, partial [Mycobacterium sp.]|nr:putative long chain acyl-CoA synthase [Mycobacterium sp.]